MGYHCDILEKSNLYYKFTPFTTVDQRNYKSKAFNIKTTESIRKKRINNYLKTIAILNAFS